MLLSRLGRTPSDDERPSVARNSDTDLLPSFCKLNRVLSLASRTSPTVLKPAVFSAFFARDDNRTLSSGVSSGSSGVGVKSVGVKASRASRSSLSRSSRSSANSLNDGHGRRLSRCFSVCQAIVLTRAQSSQRNSWHSACSPKNLIACRQRSHALAGEPPAPKITFMRSP